MQFAPRESSSLTAACRGQERVAIVLNAPTKVVPQGHRADAHGKPREPVERGPQARVSCALAVHNAGNVRQRAHSRGWVPGAAPPSKMVPQTQRPPPSRNRQRGPCPLCDPAAVAASAKQPLRRCSKSSFGGGAPPHRRRRRRHGRACHALHAPTRRRVHQAWNEREETKTASNRVADMT